MGRSKAVSNPRVLAIIQARMGSTRLPGKSLMPLGGRSVLANVVARVRLAAQVDETVVATTTLPEDDAIEAEARRLGVPVFRGADEDVLGRYYHAAAAFHGDVIVRITADCPLIDPAVIDRVIMRFGPGTDHCDYASNTLQRSYPVGLDVEVFSLAALAAAYDEACTAYEREHVTVFLYQNPDRFRLASVEAPVDTSSHRWTLDTPADLDALTTIVAKARISADFTPPYEGLLALLDN